MMGQSMGWPVRKKPKSPNQACRWLKFNQFSIWFISFHWSKSTLFLLCWFAIEIKVREMASSILKNLTRFSSSTATTNATRSFSLVTSQISNHTAKWMQVSLWFTSYVWFSIVSILICWIVYLISLNFLKWAENNVTRLIVLFLIGIFIYYWLNLLIWGNSVAII